MSIIEIVEELMVAAAEMRLAALQYATACATTAGDIGTLKTLVAEARAFDQDLAQVIELAHKANTNTKDAIA